MGGVRDGGCVSLTHDPQTVNHKVLRVTLGPTPHQHVHREHDTGQWGLRQKASSRRSDEIGAACKTYRAAWKNCTPVAWSKVSCDTSTRFPPLWMSGQQKSRRQKAQKLRDDKVTH